MIDENSQISEKVVSLLYSSIKPFFIFNSLEFDTEVVSYIAPFPAPNSLLIQNELMNFYVFLNPNIEMKNKETTIKMNFIDFTEGEKQLTFNVKINC
jgi:hypothetical protein